MQEVGLINHYWTDIYYLLHYPHEEKITHQTIRILQIIDKNDKPNIKMIANHLNISQNTASENIKRLIDKNYICKHKSEIDQRQLELKLTQFGKEVLHKNSSLDEIKLERILEALSDKDKKKILEALEILKVGAENVFSD